MKLKDILSRVQMILMNDTYYIVDQDNHPFDDYPEDSYIIEQCNDDVTYITVDLNQEVDLAETSDKYGVISYKFNGRVSCSHSAMFFVMTPHNS